MNTIDTIKEKKIYANSLPEEKEYWENIFSKDIEETKVPYDNLSNFGKKDYTSLYFDLKEGQYDKLLKLSNNSDIQLFILLSSFLTILLHKYSDSDCILFGTSVIRNDESTENLLNSILPFKYCVDRNQTYKDFLLNSAKIAKESIINQNYPYEVLNEFYENAFGKKLESLLDISIILKNIHYKHTIELLKTNLNFIFEKNSDSITCEIKYNCQKYNKEKIHRAFDHFSNIIDSVIANFDINIKEIDILNKEEKLELLIGYNNTNIDNNTFSTLNEIFENQVELIPNQVAIIANNQNYTYSEINKKANQICSGLKDNNIGNNQLVGIITDRSVNMITGILGILKAGAAYVPIKPSFPADRINFIIQDSNVDFLLLDSSSCKFCNDKNYINLDESRIYSKDCENFAPVNNENSIAYVIYTSGTTGHPKGTIITHKSVINRLEWQQKICPIGKGDVVLQKTPYTFDVSVWEIFWWFFNGAKLSLLEKDGEKYPNKIIETIYDDKITVLHFVPSMFRIFLDYLDKNDESQKLASIKQIFTSGEALIPAMVSKFNSIFKGSAKLTNLYGPTEATVDVSYYECPSKGEIETVPIGLPIDNTQLYILGYNNNIRPKGIPGELYISGIGLAEGYLNREKLTTEKFVPSITNKSDKMYKTGDLVVRREDGNIEFLGRIDNQVKLHGIRIELGEIEAQLEMMNEIKKAIVVLYPLNSSDVLCAYVVKEKDVSSKNIFKYLNEKLPNYMIPKNITFIESVPLSGNGKIDRKLLPEPVIENSSIENFVGAKNDVQESLLTIWSKVLHIDKSKIGIHDNFFTIGGDSYTVLEVNMLINEHLGEEIPAVLMYKYSTIDLLYNYISGNLSDSEDDDTDEGLDMMESAIQLLEEFDD